MGGFSRAAVVGGYDVVACLCERVEDVFELVGGLGEAVDEKDSAFGGGAGGGWNRDVGESHFVWGRDGARQVRAAELPYLGVDAVEGHRSVSW